MELTFEIADFVAVVVVVLVLMAVAAENYYFSNVHYYSSTYWKLNKDKVHFVINFAFVVVALDFVAVVACSSNFSSTRTKN